MNTVTGGNRLSKSLLPKGKRMNTQEVLRELISSPESELKYERSELIAKLTPILRDQACYKQFLGFRGLQAQRLLNLLQTLLNTFDLKEDFRDDLITAVQRLSQKSDLYPECFDLKDTVQLQDDEAITGGGFGDVYKGRFRDQYVCCKMIRVYQTSQMDRVRKRISREAILWSQLSHKNLLPFYGIYKHGPQKVCLVSPWVHNGDIKDYLERNPDVGRVHLSLDVASGLSYLHGRDIIHGDLKGANILVNDSGIACLADFGLSGLIDSQIPNWTSQSSLTSAGGSIRWQAPELFMPEDPKETGKVHNTKPSDVYAWSCVCYEIFTNKEPFFNAGPVAVMLKVMRGEMPSCPPPTSDPRSSWGLTKSIWELMNRCWAYKPAKRPVIDDVIAMLKQETREDNRLAHRWGYIPPWHSRSAVDEPHLHYTWPELITKLEHILHDKVHYKQLLRYRGLQAQHLLDLLQMLLNTFDLKEDFRNTVIVAIMRLSRNSDLYPECFDLEDTVQMEGDGPITAGSFADIYVGHLRDQRVCCKVIRVYQTSQINYTIKRISREAILWGQLSHKNLIPFYGIYKHSPRWVCLVSPWAHNGHIREYLQHNPDVGRVQLSLDVAAGLSYLHGRDTIHGNLKGVNILVNDSGIACLADFGLSGLIDLQILNWTSQSSPASVGGSVRWQAPELLAPESPKNTRKVHNRKRGDVYAWSCVCYEIFTSNDPFFEDARPSTVVLKKFIRGETPSCPPPTSAPWSSWGLTKSIWELMNRCWAYEPAKRPVIDDVIAMLKQETGEDNRPAHRWEYTPPWHLRSPIGEPHQYPGVEDLEAILSSGTDTTSL